MTPAWYETAFREHYLDLYDHRTDEAARAEAAFAAQVMGLREGTLLLDVACGAGRHARALQALGHRVVGVDLSRDLLGAARGLVRVRADMRALPFDGAFSAATSFFTSFGYFDEEGNRAALESVAGTLVPGGVFLLDFFNALVVRLHLVPEETLEKDGRRIRVRRRIENGRVLKEIRIEEQDLVLAYTESVRLYTHHDLVRMLKDAGLVPLAAYGDYDGRDFTTDAPRCILVARKA